jgi:sulfite reductase (NADPH) flavoprotein alpha-component
MLVVYGSQTGNAQDVAETLAGQLSHSGFDTCALPMDCITVEELHKEDVVLFVCSTTGTHFCCLWHRAA